MNAPKIYVAGHRGMVGSAIVRRLGRERCEVQTVGRQDVDLTRQDAVERWMAAARQYSAWLEPASASVLIGTLVSVVSLTTVMWLVQHGVLDRFLLR